jgi:methionyl-tRNA formyltransferase
VQILFFGTPDFAVPSLRALLGEGFDVVGVVTRPDRPQGRSRSTMVPSPVKAAAVAEGLTVLEPERPRGAEFLDTVRLLGPDIGVVVAYGHLLRSDLIELPPLGTLNVHASLLPLLRGAAPIQAAIREGLTETGVSIMRIVPALDAGPVLLQMATPIAPDETYGELQLRLSELGAQALIEALALVELGMATESRQDDATATYAPKVEKAVARIDWSRPAELVARAVRAYDPRPGATTTGPAGEVKLFGAQVVTEGAVHTRAVAAEAGTVCVIDDAGCAVACGDGTVRIAQVQPAGRSRMTPIEWSRGRGIRVGDRFRS